MSGNSVPTPGDAEAEADLDCQGDPSRVGEVGLELLDSADAVEYDEEAALYRLRYDPVVDSTGLAVLATVAAVTGTDPGDLQPLGSVVDVDALDGIAGGRPFDGGRNDLQVTFRYNDLDVTVDNYEVIEVSTERCT